MKEMHFMLVICEKGKKKFDVYNMSPQLMHVIELLRMLLPIPFLRLIVSSSYLRRPLTSSFSVDGWNCQITYYES
jgi:hypothetical protein